MGFARALATTVFILALPVALVTSNVRLLINAPLVYSYSFDRYDAEDATGLSRSDIDATAGALRGYFNSGEKTFYHEVTEGGLKEPVFNARETRHMQDVKRIVSWTNRVQEVAAMYVLAYVVACFIWVRDGSLRQLAGQALAGLALGLAAVGAAGIAAVVSFDAAWDRFHAVIFSGGSWQFDPATDHLIQMFPEAFWRDAVLFLGAMCAVEAFLIAAASVVYLMGTRSERTRLPASLDVSSSRPHAA
ncbi:MAG: TIGR01906 family membrane protein [Dehalococcoidia bacterium]